MKIIKYKMGTSEVTLSYNEENMAIAEKEAIGSEYTIEELEDTPRELSVQERLAVLEKAAEAPDYTAGTWYYRGDKVTFESDVYVCIAPESAVCVWSPAEYPSYWQKQRSGR